MKYVIVIILIFILGCVPIDRSPNINKVSSTIICSSNSVMKIAMDSIIVDLYDNYRLSDKSKSNYEAYCQQFSLGVNWNPKEKILFAGFGSDLCGSWKVVFINVDENKLKSFISTKIPVSGINGPYSTFSKFFEEEKDNSNAFEFIKKYFATNSCNGNG
jgi:hypothetical protein